MKEFNVTLHYKVTLDGDEESLQQARNLHILDAVYNQHVGNLYGVTETKPELQYTVEETEATIEVV